MREGADRICGDADQRGEDAADDRALDDLLFVFDRVELVNHLRKAPRGDGRHEDDGPEEPVGHWFNRSRLNWIDDAFQSSAIEIDGVFDDGGVRAQVFREV